RGRPRRSRASARPAWSRRGGGRPRWSRRPSRCRPPAAGTRAGSGPAPTAGLRPRPGRAVPRRPSYRVTLGRTAAPGAVPGDYETRKAASGARNVPVPLPTLAGMAHHVLVVDDDPTVAEVVVGYLRRAGLEAELAEDGHRALALAAARPPALVVLDLMMPGIDGLEVCR